VALRSHDKRHAFVIRRVTNLPAVASGNPVDSLMITAIPDTVPLPASAGLFLGGLGGLGLLLRRRREDFDTALLAL